MNIALIMMGGGGTRFGASIPKQFVEVDGRPVFSYLLDAYERFEPVDAIYVVSHPKWVEFASEWARRLGAKKLADVVPGGSSRSQSIRFGLDSIAAGEAGDSIVLIHDVTHPFLDRERVKVCLEKARAVGAATLVGSCFDTMYRVDGDSCIESVAPRELLVSATAPECFRLDLLYPMYEGKSPEELEAMTSAAAMMVANGRKVEVVRTPLINLKITLHEDMEAFKKLMHGYYYE